jgi:hypothetical protein
MENTENEKALTEAITACTNEDGWANLAEIGGILREKGVKYGKLSKFISRYPELVETRIDETRQPPVVYARLIDQT